MENSLTQSLIKVVIGKSYSFQVVAPSSSPCGEMSTYLYTLARSSPAITLVLYFGNKFTSPKQ